jgi:hypothetical protein
MGNGQIVPINNTGIVTIPPPKNAPAGTISTPSGTVFNGSSDFVLPAPNGKPALFIFATEDGTISGWNGGPSAVLAVDNNDKGSANGAVYKGLTTADIDGQRFLYVTNFRSGHVEVYDTNFYPVRLSNHAFEVDGDGDHDRDDHKDGQRIPEGFAPFNIQNIGGSLFVTYAKQDSARHDDVAGPGNGFVEIFTPLADTSPISSTVRGELSMGRGLDPARLRRVQQHHSHRQFPQWLDRRFQRVHLQVYRLREKSQRFGAYHRWPVGSRIRQWSRGWPVHNLIFQRRTERGISRSVWHFDARGDRTHRRRRVASRKVGWPNETAELSMLPSRIF